MLWLRNLLEHTHIQKQSYLRRFVQNGSDAVSFVFTHQVLFMCLCIHWPRYYKWLIGGHQNLQSQMSDCAMLFILRHTGWNKIVFPLDMAESEKINNACLQTLLANKFVINLRIIASSSLRDMPIFNAVS